MLIPGRFYIDMRGYMYSYDSNPKEYFDIEIYKGSRLLFLRQENVCDDDFSTLKFLLNGRVIYCHYLSTSSLEDFKELKNECK